MTKEIKRQALQIDWVDSKSWAGWQDRQQWMEHLKDQTCDITSLGFLLYEDDNYLSLAQSWGVNNAADVIQIPKKCIIKRKELDL